MDPIVDQLAKQLSQAEQGHTTSLVIVIILLGLYVADKLVFWVARLRSNGNYLGTPGAITDIRNRIVDVDRHVKDVGETGLDISKSVDRVGADLEKIGDAWDEHRRESRAACARTTETLDRIERKISHR